MLRGVLRPPGRKAFAGLVLMLTLSILLAGCGSNDSAQPSKGMDIAPAIDRDDSEMADGEAAPAMYREGEELAYQAESAGQIAYDRLVIRTAQITLTVEHTVEATASVRDLAVSRGGFVFSSTTYTERDHHYAQLTLRVPADRFDETISALRSAPYVTEVTREESSSQDVSAEYVDNESRLTALEETQRRYLSLLSDANTIEAILRLESELTSVRSQIETIKGRQNYLSEMTAFSTITVNLRPVEDPHENDPDDGIAILRIFESAWERSTGALAGVAEAIVVIGIFALFFAPLVALAYALFRVARRMLGRAAA